MPYKIKLNEVDKVEITTLIDNYVDVVAFKGTRDNNGKSE